MQTLIVELRELIKRNATYLEMVELEREKQNYHFVNKQKDKVDKAKKLINEASDAILILGSRGM